jgi:hypothetical protein
MAKLNCSNLLNIIDFTSNIIRKAKYVLSNTKKWKMYSDINFRISKKIIQLFKKLNIENVYDEKKRIFLINDTEKEIIALLFSAIVIISCYISDISNSPYLLFKDIDYHKAFDKEKRYIIDNPEIKSYIDLFNSYYESSRIEYKLLSSFKEDKTYSLYLKDLKSLINELMNKITLKEFDDESSNFIDNLSKFRLTPINDERITRKTSYDSLQCDSEIRTYTFKISPSFMPISPLHSSSFFHQSLLV